MRLNNDCIRDIMLYIENNLNNHNDSVSFKDMSETLKKYNEETLTYHVSLLKDAGLIEGYSRAGALGIIFINDLTWQGHQYLDNIRDDGVWKAVKEKANILGSVSLQILIPLAESIIKQNLGLN